MESRSTIILAFVFSILLIFAAVPLASAAESTSANKKEGAPNCKGFKWDTQGFYKNQTVENVSQAEIVQNITLSTEEFIEILQNDSNFTDMLNYSKELGYDKINKSFKILYDDGTEVTIALVTSNKKKTIFLTKIRQKDKDNKINKKAFLQKLEVKNGTVVLTMFDRKGGMEVDLQNKSLMSVWGHGSCEYFPCIGYCFKWLFFDSFLLSTLCSGLCDGCVFALIDGIPLDEIPTCTLCTGCLLGAGVGCSIACGLVDTCSYYPCFQDCADNDYYDPWVYYCSDDYRRYRHKMYYPQVCEHNSPAQSGRCVTDTSRSGWTNEEYYGYCTHGCNAGSGTCNDPPPPIEIPCYNDAECQDDGWSGSRSCSGGDVYQWYKYGECINDGQSNSYCRQVWDYRLKEPCTGGDVCDGGYCGPPPGCPSDYPYDCAGYCWMCYDSDASLCCPDDNSWPDWCCFDNGPYCNSNTGQCNVCGGDYPYSCNDRCWSCPSGGDLCCPSNGDPSLCCGSGSVCMGDGSCCYPTTETCDGRDNDCDGQVDEGLTMGCGTGACAGGIQTCSNGNWGGCSTGGNSNTEICNNLDDDCDGSIDESLSQQCGTSSTGACTLGTQTCSAGSWTVCNAVYPVQETCNNIDDDCDSSTDESLSQQCGTSNTGACTLGTQTCSAGTWTGCNAVNPVTETCNNIDDDCDGSTDESLSQSCGTSNTGACTYGTQTCSAGSWVGCNAVNPVTETCNNIDDDCDGSTDESLSQSCGVSDVGACTLGTETCSAGGWVECNAVLPTTEICDGLDNDCDGSTDEGGVCDNDGDGYAPPEDCNDNDETIYPGAPDPCDGVDQACDGIDNEVDADNDGVLLCADDCNDNDETIYPGAPDPCDGIDQACDGIGNEIDADSDEVLNCTDTCPDVYGEASDGCPIGFYNVDVVGAIPDNTNYSIKDQTDAVVASGDASDISYTSTLNEIVDLLIELPYQDTEHRYASLEFFEALMDDSFNDLSMRLDYLTRQQIIDAGAPGLEAYTTPALVVDPLTIPFSFSNATITIEYNESLIPFEEDIIGYKCKSADYDPVTHTCSNWIELLPCNGVTEECYKVDTVSNFLIFENVTEFSVYTGSGCFDVNADGACDYKYIITDTYNHRVIQVTSNKNIQWQYGGERGNGYNQLNFPFDAVRLSNRHTIITDSENHRIIEVDSSNNIVWQYGTTGIRGSGNNQLSSPADAVRLVNGNILITDTSNHRIIEVDPSSNIVWQYGTTGAAGSGPDELGYPYDAARLISGNTLIVDRANHRVIEVDSTNSIVWQYGTTGVSGSENNQLSGPTDAVRLFNGNTLIADTYNHRIIEVDSSNSIVWQYGTTGVRGSGYNTLYRPYDAVRLVNGNTLITDAYNHRVIEVDSSNSIVWQYGTTGVRGSGYDELRRPFDCKIVPVDSDKDSYYSDVDCDDTSPEISPGAVEICNEIDDDCDGQTDEGNVCAPVVTFDITPDTLNIKSKGKWITGFIEFDSDYDVRDIDPATVLLEGVVPAVTNPKYDFVINESEYLVDHNENGILERKFKFERVAVQALLTPSTAELVVTGSLLDGTPFEGNDTIRAIKPGREAVETRIKDIEGKWQNAAGSDEKDSYTQSIADNLIWWYYSIVPPDLTLESSDIVTSNLLIGEEAMIDVTIHNNGGTDAGEFSIELLVDGGLLSTTTRSLEAESVTTIQFIWPVENGAHDIEIVLDADDEVLELNEENNVAGVKVVGKKK